MVGWAAIAAVGVSCTQESFLSIQLRHRQKRTITFREIEFSNLIYLLGPSKLQTHIKLQLNIKIGIRGRKNVAVADFYVKIYHKVQSKLTGYYTLLVLMIYYLIDNIFFAMASPL